MIVKPRFSVRALLAVCALILLSACTGDTLKRSYLEYASDHLPPPTRPVIVMTGFGSAKLYDPKTQRYVWGTAHATLQTRYEDNLDLPINDEREEIENDRLVPRGFVGSRGPLNFAWHISNALHKYGKYSMASDAFRPHQQEPKTVYRFAYDWRISATDNAVQLDRMIEDIRLAYRNPTLKVDIVAHSLGGFVTLTYLRLGTAPLDAPDRWEAASRAAVSKVGSVVLLAPPQDGAVDAFRVLIRPERFVMRVLGPEWTTTYPSLVEMLPSEGRILIDEKGRPLEIDLWDISAWRKYKLSIFSDQVRERVIRRASADHYRKLTVAFEKSLGRARVLRRAHQLPLPSGVAVTIIASDCMPTTRRVLMRRDGTFAFYDEELSEDEAHLRPVMFVPGDGSITTESATGGRLEEAMVFCDGHQGMALDAGVHHAVLRALQRGMASAPASSQALQ